MGKLRRLMVVAVCAYALICAAAPAEAAMGRKTRSARARKMQITAISVELAGTELDQSHLLQYPPRPMPAKACACRVGPNRTIIPRACPSPWDSIAGYSKVPPPLKLTAEGDILNEITGQKAQLHGINWFGWETATPSVDGLWAYSDTELPPLSSVHNDSLTQLQLDFDTWGKRTMTNDFAHVVHRMRSLGFNAVRLPMNFTNLQQPIARDRAYPSDLYPCVRDSLEYINLEKTLDPEVRASIPADQAAAAAPPYTGPPHPPPVLEEDEAACSLPWQMPFLSEYQAPNQFGQQLQLTLCNWYMPSNDQVQGLHRFLWQVQYLVSQGFYVLIDHSSYLDKDPNMLSPALFARNWGNLWRIITELPDYPISLRGRVFPDLVNEPSRWGCQWERDCIDAQGQKSCAPGSVLYHDAMAAIHTWDPSVAVFANALGQAGVDKDKFPTCSNYYKGMNYGDGTITNREVIAETGISDASSLFQNISALSLGKLALSPHVYPSTVTGWGEHFQKKEELYKRLDLSFGLKALGQDKTSDDQPLRRIAVILGEFGVTGHSGSSHSRTPQGEEVSEADVTFLQDLAQYLQSLQEKGAAISWFWWAWNANSGDTKGITGPDDSWRDVQYKKVRLLTQLYGLRPWYCAVMPSFCGTQTS